MVMENMILKLILQFAPFVIKFLWAMFTQHQKETAVAKAIGVPPPPVKAFVQQKLINPPVPIPPTPKQDAIMDEINTEIDSPDFKRIEAGK